MRFLSLFRAIVVAVTCWSGFEAKEWNDMSRGVSQGEVSDAPAILMNDAMLLMQMDQMILESNLAHKQFEIKRNSALNDEKQKQEMTMDARTGKANLAAVTFATHERGQEMCIEGICNREDKEWDIQMFKDWLVAAQVLNENVTMSSKASYGRGYGFQTKRDIKKGEIIMRIPLNITLSMDSMKNSRMGVFYEVNPSLPDMVLMAIHIMEQKALGKNSTMYHFFKSIPSELANSLYLSEDDMALAEGTQLDANTKARLKGIQSYYDALEPALMSKAVDPPLFTSDTLTFENFKWAMCVVWGHGSLVEIMPVNATQPVLVIAPVLASMEHDPLSKHIVVIDDRNGFLNVLAGENIAAGDTIRINLGGKTALSFMLNHGFVSDSPSNNKYSLGIDIDPEDPLYFMKEKILEQVNIVMKQEYLFDEVSEKIPADALMSLRIKLLKGEEIENYKLATQGKPVSVRNEYVLHRTILDACLKLRSRHTTTIAEDDALLAGGTELNERRRNIIKYRRIEKMILNKVEQVARRHWANLLDAPLIR